MFYPQIGLNKSLKFGLISNYIYQINAVFGRIFTTTSIRMITLPLVLYDKNGKLRYRVSLVRLYKTLLFQTLYYG